MFEQSHPVSITGHMVANILMRGLSAKQDRAEGLAFQCPYIDPEAPNLPARLQSLAILSGEQRFETLR